MTSKTSIISATSAEFIKNRKKISNYFIAVLMPCVYWVLFLFIANNFQGTATENELSVSSFPLIQLFLIKPSFLSFLGTSWGMSTFLLTPCICAVFPSILTHLEYKYKMNKVLLTSPTKITDIFFAKIIISLFYIAIFLIITSICQVIIYKYYNTQALVAMDMLRIVTMPLALLLFMLPIVIIHTWLGMKFNLYLINIGIALVITMISNSYTYSNSDSSLYYFYSLPLQFIISLSDKTHPSNILATWQYVIYGVLINIVLLALSYFELTRNRIKA